MEAVLVAALVGGTANAAGNTVGQFIEQYDPNEDFLTNVQTAEINGQEVVISGVAGALAGATAPVTGPGGYIAVKAAAGAGQKVATDMIVEGKSLEESILDPNTAVAGVIGAASTVAGGYMPSVPTHIVKSNGEIIAYAVGKDALAFGGSQFRKTTEQMLLEQRTTLNVRTAAGIAVTSIPVQVNSACSGFDCLAEWFGWHTEDLNSIPCTADPNDNY